MRHVTSIALLLLLMLNAGVSSFSVGKSNLKKTIARQPIPSNFVVSSAIPGQGSLRKLEVKKNSEKVIMILQTRDHLVTIYSRDENCLYSVGTKEGIALAEKVSSAELKARFPELHEIVTEGVAVDSPMPLK